MTARPGPARLLGVLLGLWIFGGAVAARENVSRSPRHSIGPRIAADATGRNHVVWADTWSSTSGDVFYASGTPGHGWTAPVQVSSSGKVHAESPVMCDLDVDASGRVFVFWVEAAGVRLRILSGGAWGEIQTVDSGGGFNRPKIDVDPEGNAFMVWNTSDLRVYSRALFRGSWEPIRLVSDSAKFADLGVGRDVVFVGFIHKSGGFYKTCVASRAKSGGAEWSEPQRIASSNASIEDEFQVVECDGSDRVHAMWAYYVGGGRYMAYAGQSADGSWLQSETLSPVQNIHNPSATRRGDGMFLCWQVGPWGDGDAVLYSGRVDGTWSGPHVVPDSYGSTNSDVAVAPSGNELRFVWDAGGEIWYGAVPASAGGSSPTARFSVSPAAGPRPLTVAFDASASSDDGVIGRYRWDFGDGAFGEGRITQHTYEREGVFSARLTVIDDQGLSGSADRIITVFEPVVHSPLNIRWETQLDESLFLRRYVTDVRWDHNPANDAVSSLISFRIHRKPAGAPPSAYVPIGHVPAGTWFFRDRNAGGIGRHEYTVTSIDPAGNESPIPVSAPAVGSRSSPRRSFGRPVIKRTSAGRMFRPDGGI